MAICQEKDLKPVLEVAGQVKEHPQAITNVYLRLKKYPDFIMVPTL